MSILLDSLKKSEAQRGLGSAPSIYSDDYVSHSSQQFSGWPMWILLALTAVAISWFGWQQYAQPELAATATRAHVQTAEDAKPAAGDSNERNSQTATAERTQESAPAETSVSEMREGVSAARDAKRPSSADGSWASLAKSVATYTAPEVRDANTDELTSPEVEEPELAPDEAQDSSDPILELERFPQAQEVAAAPGSSAISYWSLPQSIRNSLPEFRITVLVYADNPDDRFVLMNGERLREQDSPTTGVVLEEIRREGAVFTYRNYRFMVTN